MNPYYNPYPPQLPIPRPELPKQPIDIPNFGQRSEDIDLEDRWANVAKAAPGILSLAGDWLGMANQGLGLEGRETPSTRSYSGDYYNRAANAQVQRTSGGEVLGGVAKGAAAGSAFGPLGTAIGAGAGGIGTIFAGNRRRRRQEDERNEALADSLAYQSDYNKAQTTLDQQQTSAADYSRRIDNYNRNLYSWTAI